MTNVCGLREMCIRDRNKIPDTLSRVDFEGNKTGRDLKEIEIFRLSREDRLFGEELTNLKTMQRSDTKLKKIIASLESDPDNSAFNRYFQVYQGILFKKIVGGERDWKVVIPEGLVDKII